MKLPAEGSLDWEGVTLAVGGSRVMLPMGYSFYNRQRKKNIEKNVSFQPTNSKEVYKLLSQ